MKMRQILDTGSICVDTRDNKSLTLWPWLYVHILVKVQ